MNLKSLLKFEDENTNTIARNLLYFMNQHNIDLDDIQCGHIIYEGETIFKLPMGVPKRVKYDTFLDFMKLSKYYKHVPEKEIIGTFWVKSEIGNPVWFDLNNLNSMNWTYHRLPSIPSSLDGFDEGYNRKIISSHSGDVWVEVDNKGIYHYDIRVDIGCGDQSIKWEWESKEKNKAFSFPLEELKREWDDYDFEQLEPSAYGFSLRNGLGYVTIVSNEFKVVEPSKYHLELAQDSLEDRTFWWREDE